MAVTYETKQKREVKPIGRAFVDLERGGQRFVLRTPFNRAFIEALKDEIDPWDREWAGPPQKLWAVARHRWHDVKVLLKRYFAEIVYGPAGKAAAIEEELAQATPADLGAYMALGLRSDAPDCVVHAAYLSLERAHCEAAYLVSYAAVSGMMLEHLPNEGLMDLGSVRHSYLGVCRQRQTPTLIPPGTADGWPRGPIPSTLAVIEREMLAWPGCTRDPATGQVLSPRLAAWGEGDS